MDSVVRLTDAKALSEAVAKHMEGLDLGFRPQDWLDNPLNIGLTDGRNIALFECKGVAWEGHIIFEDRGSKALSVGKEMLAHMFDNYLAKVIKGLTPAHKRAARLFSRKLGFKSFGMIDTVNGPMELFILERSR